MVSTPKSHIIPYFNKRLDGVVLKNKAVLVSFPFPITKILLLISAEPSVNIEDLAKKVVEIFTDVK